MSDPQKIVVERTGEGSNSPSVAIHFAGFLKFVSEDTAQVLARALQQVAFGEKTRLTVYEETNHRPAGVFAD